MSKCIIRNREGNPVKTSRNLRGIREHVGRHVVKVCDVCEVGARGEGQLSILFENGDSFQTLFASYVVLLRTVRQWRNLYGAPLSIGGEHVGEVYFDNYALVNALEQRDMPRRTRYFLQATTALGPLNCYITVLTGERLWDVVNREAQKRGLVFCSNWTAQPCAG